MDQPRTAIGLLRHVLALLGLASAALAAPMMPSTAAEAVKIGVITTLTGPGAIVATQMNQGMQEAMEELGGKIGGLAAEVTWVDDQQKPVTGRQVADELLTRYKVDFVTGAIWSNVLMAVFAPVTRSETFLIGANAGPSEIAGQQCSPFFFSASVQNDEESEAMGAYLASKGVNNLFIIAPNFAGGRDNVAGLKRYYKGEIAGEVYVPLTQEDFATEVSRISAAKPGAVYAFTPGGMGVQFVNQYAQAGLNQRFPLYTVYSVDETNLVAQGDAAVGVFETRHWNHDLDIPANKNFVKRFVQQHHALPSFYAAEGRDAIMLIDSAVRAVKGNLSNKAAVRAALEKADFNSVRGDFAMNTNHFPIQNFYLVNVVKSASGEVAAKTVSTIFKQQKDFYYHECLMK